MKLFRKKNLIEHYRRSSLFGIGDFIVVLAVIFACTLAAKSLVGSDTGIYADVYVKGEIVMSVPLNTDALYAVPDTRASIEVADGKIAVVENDCPNKICIKTGFVSRSGAAIVCAPNGITVIVRGGDPEYVTGVHR